LTFDGADFGTTADVAAAINAGNVVLAFGSPDTFPGNPNPPPPVSEPGTMLLLGSGLVGLVACRRLRSRA
jgi:hypothetical protein